MVRFWERCRGGEVQGLGRVQRVCTLAHQRLAPEERKARPHLLEGGEEGTLMKGTERYLLKRSFK